MAGNYLYQIKTLVLRLVPLYLLYFICRVLFWFFNRDIFYSLSFSGFLSDSWHGLRFDSFSICVASSLFILLSALPVKAFYEGWYQKLLKWVFIIPNALFLLLNCIDFAYFPFTKKRSGADLFKQVGGQTDMAHLLPQYVRDFWWVLVVFILLVILMLVLFNKIKIKPPVLFIQNTGKQNIVSACVFILILGFTFLGIRGGFARAPIDIIDAGVYTSVEEIPLVLNTPFTIIKSLDKNELKEHNFYTSTELQLIYNPVHKFDSLTFRKKNIVIIILESFAKEYTALGKTGVSYTPFLDSLAAQSFVFTNGFANGSKSIEGIPAILSGIPHLMENPFINSPYAGNFQTSFGTLLGKEGYTTAFFHGGINGTMNFDAYAKLAGYQNYFGKNEYNNDADFDGFWGIWDEPFLQYSIKKMNEFKEPFHSSVFTLSSHHPYFVPEKYKGKFPKGTLENSESVGYSDYALKLFFQSAKKTKWYNNTLFVLCADHTSLSDHPFYRNSVGQQCIPILFFNPGNPVKGTYEKSFSQIDILPSVMNILGYNKPFFAFGQSYLKNKNSNCYYYLNGNVMMIEDTIMTSFNKDQIASVYNFKKDSGVSKNIKNRYPLLEERLSKEYKAFIQSYNSTLIHNKGSLK